MVSLFRRKSTTKLRAGIAVDDETAVLALVERDGAVSRLHNFAVSTGSGRSWSALTDEVVDKVELRRVPVTAVVNESVYQLVLVECPQVPKDEIAAAVRWRIKDLVGFSADDAVIDTIEIPALANQSGGPMLYAVAAEPGSVKKLVDAISDQGLRLDSIDIPELCLRNIATCLPQEPRGVGLLHLEEEHGTLIISRAGTLYLIRRIDVGLRAVRSLCAGELTTGDTASEIALEVQRSLDYFESHYDQRPITDIVLGPGTPPAFAGLLHAQLGVPVEALDLNDVVDLATPIPLEQQAAVVVALGAALRTEEAAA
ncbi:MAG: hypothetical protein HKN70_03430 [Gammaproteobacteria bacterium]|nr:hypothetical protein [Gammaproteobacteria bacterium]